MLIKKQRIPVKEMILIGLLPSSLKKIYYRLKGYQFGKNVSIGFGSVIIGENVYIGDNTKIGFLSVIRARDITLKRYIRIGSLVFIDTEKVFIDDDARINENVIVAGIKFPDSFFCLGKRTIVMEYSYINPTKPVTIGDDSGIGGHCLLFTHGSWLPMIDGFPVTFAPISLGKKVWLPWRVFVMPGVELGDNVVIGANSLVSKSIPSNALAAGSPAKVVKENYPPEITDDDRTTIIENIFKDFINYLRYNSLVVHYYKEDTDYLFEVNHINKKLIMRYVKEVTGKYSTLNCDLLICDSNKVDINEYKTSAKMLINLDNKTRVGASLLGEEFVLFISRYGIRFDRLD